MIHIENFTYQVANFKLQNIELEIKENEIFAFLGKTGSGKTMLLEAIAGFYRGNCGAIYISGKDVVDIVPEERKIGFVYQDFGLFPHMTVYENIRYGLKMHRVEKSKMNLRISDMAKLLGIEHILKHYPATLSGGERQRTALARALVLQPRILLMDEPFSALDPGTRSQMYQLVEQIHKTFACTILFVTHNLYEAERMAQRIGIMVNGKLKMVCNTDKLFQNYEDTEILEFIGGYLNDNGTDVSKIERRLNADCTRLQPDK
ncbi:ATP-binding cassette domain-containing protein [Anaeromicropila populeti]|uniref:Molybdate transport system ATP-binding protein n=1 Tax=Anaeromicropila populeti TaxID=37658 RepID=A0A1I6JAQ2_9FIRM|nr:ATP-binding cassette domain-containing protein [Anaeromicropila populeti]SFR76067.1 molybdate transport system ATP-binding protein [Anaeromicropila populeti]